MLWSFLRYKVAQPASQRYDDPCPREPTLSAQKGGGLRGRVQEKKAKTRTSLLPGTPSAPHKALLLTEWWINVSFTAHKAELPATGRLAVMSSAGGPWEHSGEVPLPPSCQSCCLGRGGRRGEAHFQSVPHQPLRGDNPLQRTGFVLAPHPAIIGQERRGSYGADPPSLPQSQCRQLPASPSRARQGTQNRQPN